MSFAVLGYIAINNGLDIITSIGVIANIIGIALIIALEYMIRKGKAKRSDNRISKMECKGRICC